MIVTGFKRDSLVLTRYLCDVCFYCECVSIVSLLAWLSGFAGLKRLWPRNAQEAPDCCRGKYYLIFFLTVFIRYSSDFYMLLSLIIVIEMSKHLSHMMILVVALCLGDELQVTKNIKFALLWRDGTYLIKLYAQRSSLTRTKYNVVWCSSFQS